MPPLPAGQPIDLLIDARWIIPVEPFRTLLENHAVAIHNGRILGLLPSDQAHVTYQARRRVSLNEHVLIPGLINLHSHAAMSLLRGYADDQPLMRWLQEHIWPAEGRLVCADFVRDGTLLAGAEMLRGGITCFNDMYFFPEAAAQSIQRLGMRAVLGLITLEFPSAYASDASDYLSKGLATRDRLANTDRIGFTLAPHAPYSVEDKTFERIVTLAAQLDLSVHIHIHETAQEIEESMRLHGMRPLERLHRLGLLGPHLIGVHAVHLNGRDLALLADHGCSIVHCPTSNMKLASGIAPITAAMEQGIRVGLGTDGSASNNRCDLFWEMRHGALLGKVATDNAAAFDAHTMLRMATLEGATALGLENDIGSLRPGKCADLCAVRLDDWILQPCFDPASHLLYAAGREQVSHVWVQGDEKVTDGQLNDTDINELLDISALWQNNALMQRGNGGSGIPPQSNLP
ncbi:TRZ/ATZ family hydrolase [Denitratisoma oestradiolicum]|uniref:5-methylthioadenosine/S-adenosylhomocysteine deaminase n=1 Tax=Denitratisoma oestradiolicum TaxID=311182 RepID=A0A6S6XY77_9PROT|nr:TRZ/ATZ family hydrolase [Denitratisoma oestradiolicum]CAB1369968.1 5-methylthioadenosine/S-adenosylhomocysteine deaminase [Denitratisoma oestradiolicum]